MLVVKYSLTGEGVTKLEALDATDVPFALVAVTVNEYETPAVKAPVTVKGELAPVAVKLPTFDVTV